MISMNHLNMKVLYCDWKNKKEYILLYFLHENSEERKLEKLSES